MKRIKWDPLEKENREHGSPLPTIRGHKYTSDNRTDVRLVKLSGNNWGVMVTTIRTSRATSMKGAKALGGKIADEMAGQ